MRRTLLVRRFCRDDANAADGLFQQPLILDKREHRMRQELIPALEFVELDDESALHYIAAHLRYQARAELIGKGSAHHKAPGLYAHDQVYLLAYIPVGHEIDHALEHGRVLAERGYVLEEYPLLGEVRDVPDGAL